MSSNENTAKDLTAMVFSFLSFKAKIIVLGIIIGLFFIILIPVIALASLTSIDNDDEINSSSVVSQGTGTAISEIIPNENLYKYANAKFVMPFETWNPNSDVMTSKYGYRIHPIQNTKKFHTGIDLVVISIINPRIISVESGIVSQVLNSNSYGNAVEVQHFLEDGSVIYSFYAHMKDNTVTVKVGDIVEKGQTLGEMGSTGWSTGSHLHFEIRTASGSNNYTNPTNYIFGIGN
ncbi:MAG: M23 family metallopeptidase [Clostridia bacterium]|nr:M23 family metallopeptidase [Clostridia bacterium]